jgi:hypothetical protein
LANFRPRLLIAATVLATLALLIAAAAAQATPVRVEGPRGNVFQGTVTPFVGTLKDQNGVSHSTKQVTALGALVAASRSKPFPLGLTWSDSFGGGWAGFFINSVNRVAPPPTAFWAVKIKQKLTSVGAGAAPVTPTSSVLVYYTTYDPNTFATEKTLAITSSAKTIVQGTPVNITVRAYDDAGHPTPGSNAWVWVNGVGVHANAQGVAVVRLGKPGMYSIRSTAPNEIPSQTLWIRATAS